MIFGFIDKEVQLGFAPNMDPAKRHGMATVKTSRGVTKLPFTVDKPHRLKRPSDWAIERMFRQVKALEHEPLAIEFVSGKNLRVYKMQGGKPVLVQVSPRK